MITVKELIEHLKLVDPNAYVVFPGGVRHVDDTFWDICIPKNGLKLLTIEAYDNHRWAGSYGLAESKTEKSVWAYCL